MTSTFVDTSGFFALLDEDDEHHVQARRWMEQTGADPALALISHSYVIVETAALISRRLGRDATRVFFDAWTPALSVLYVDEALHRTAVNAYLSASSTRVSLVDHVSFAMMRSEGIRHALAFDRDFTAQGFELVA